MRGDLCVQCDVFDGHFQGMYAASEASFGPETYPVGMATIAQRVQIVDCMPDR
jgi:hypothetical protein